MNRCFAVCSRYRDNSGHWTEHWTGFSRQRSRNSHQFPSLNFDHRTQMFTIGKALKVLGFIRRNTKMFISTFYLGTLYSAMALGYYRAIVRQHYSGKRRALGLGACLKYFSLAPFIHTISTGHVATTRPRRIRTDDLYFPLPKRLLILYFTSSEFVLLSVAQVTIRPPSIVVLRSTRITEVDYSNLMF